MDCNGWGDGKAADLIRAALVYAALMRAARSFLEMAGKTQHMPHAGSRTNRAVSVSRI